MKPTYYIWAFVLFFLAQQPAIAQSCNFATVTNCNLDSIGGCGGTGNTEPDPGTLASGPWQNHFIPLTRLGNHRMPSFGNGDSLSLPFWLDRAESCPFGSDGFQETWYFPRENESGTAPFHRLFSGSLGDHLDSPDPNAGSSLGYVLEILHGYPYTSVDEGLEPIHRYLNPPIFDHRTWLTTPPAGYGSDAVWSSSSSTPRYAYPRYGNYLDQCSSICQGQAENFKLANSDLEVVFNPVYGNAIALMTYRGKQIATQNIGEMVQSTIWYGGPGGVLLNPTQSGGVDGQNFNNTRRYAGSPVLSTVWNNPGADPETEPISMTTVVRPLNFTHHEYVDTDPFTPLAWRAKFELTTTLGCKVDGSFHRNVIHRKHRAKLDPDAIIPAGTVFNMNEVGWFLLDEFGDCNLPKSILVTVVDLATGTLDSNRFMSCDQLDEIDNSRDKAVIVTSADRTFALGFVRLGDDPLHRYSTWFRCGPSCAPEHTRLVINSFDFKNLSASAWTAEEAAYVLGSPTEVFDLLLGIHGDGGDCLND